ncbi:hypothetical protein Y1Q_0008564 [Alligator mississippiensis]|uniref:Uncharacterized protein n=1 Tax=Alligator mississippiensis TaxID=8496 RepID=A0A151NR86_ALLMI|nr:hypothetical protein Y1Q_0008564 [Alligator mississippiensis]
MKPAADWIRPVDRTFPIPAVVTPELKGTSAKEPEAGAKGVSAKEAPEVNMLYLWTVFVSCPELRDRTKPGPETHSRIPETQKAAG